MYAPRWLRGANEQLWAALAGRLRERGIVGVPPSLTEARDLMALWRSPDLLLAQTCGYPLMTALKDSVTPVATFHYDAEGCEGAWHRSALIVRADDPAQDLAALTDRRVAINGTDSNTGMNLLRASVAPLAGGHRFFAQVIVTGAHARSLAAVAAGHADVAAIDAVTLALLRDQWRGIDRRIRVLGWTDSSPGLPLICAATTPAATLSALRESLADLFADPGPARGALIALRLTGFSVLDRATYETVSQLAERAAALGYPELA